MKIDKSMLNLEQQFVLNDLLPKVKNLLVNNNFKRPEVKLEDRMFTLTSSAGCGKSFLTSVLLKEFAGEGFHMRSTSTTHKSLATLDEMIMEAQVNVESSTIHSYLGLRLKENHTTGKQELIQEYGNKPPEDVDILFCDESSMLSAELFEYVKGALEQDIIKVAIFISDAYQLNPVAGEAFPLYTNDKVTKYELTTVVRQAADSNILKLATLIRDNIISGNHLSNFEIKEAINEYLGDDIKVVNSEKDLLTTYYNSEYTPESNLVIGYKNTTVNKYNKKIRNTLLEEDECFSIGEQLVFNEAHFSNDGTTCYHRNNQTVTIKSLKKLQDTSLNISYWKIVDEMNEVFRAVDFDDLDDFSYELNELSSQAKKASGINKQAMWKRFFELKSSFQSVSYTYAFTSHRTQGSTCNEAYILLDEILSMRGITGADAMLRSLYVSITRAKHRLIIYMK